LTYDVSTLAAKHGPWSITKAGVAETCAAQFHHRYIIRTTTKIEASVSKVGTAAHTVLEHRVAGVDILDAKKIALEKTPLTGTEQEDLRALEDSIESFLRRFDAFCRREHVVEVLREVEWGFTQSYTSTGYLAPDVYFRGKLDLGVVTQNRDLMIIDHKSGAARNIQQDIKKKHQLYSYAVLAAANIPDLCGVRCGIHFLQGSEDLRLQWLDYIETPRIKQIYVPWLYRYLNDVSENLAEPFRAQPKPTWPCKWCEYRLACPEYQEMTGGG
jgi:hypothetical protein